MLHKKIFFILITLSYCVFSKTAVAAMSVSLAVPFTSQAPQGIWIEPWQNACEESVILMLDAYYQQYTFSDVAANKGIRNILYLKELAFGYSLDEDASTVVTLINNYLPWEASIVENPTLSAIKKEIDARRPVIVPTYGKGLRNPYFQDGGPDYHTIIISGYDDATQEFITQEPGTSYGNNYRYPYTRLQEAIHDFVPNKKTALGARRVIFTQPTIDSSANLDPDNDGATKLVEIQYKTLLHDADTDNDGFSDGLEIQQGYSPRLDELGLLTRKELLVKTASSPYVYVIYNKQKQHIRDAATFVNRGWKWGDMIVVSDRFLNSLDSGPQIQ